MKKRILFASWYGPNDIANFNCAHGPFSQMRDEVEIIVPTGNRFDAQTMATSQWWNDFTWWLGIDVAFIHRPYGYFGQQILKAAKSHHVPIWVHHDDDLLAIPETNPYHEAYVKQDNQFPSVEESYRQADILTCQSVLMKQMLKEKYDRDAILLPICLDDRLLKLSKRWSDNNRIMWRGSDSHKHDLLSFKVELQAIFDKYKEKEFHFTILNPRELGFKVKNLVVHPGLPMFEFYNMITEVNASHHLVVLQDNEFNRVKSHLAWLDASLAGSSVLAPNFPEFDRSGCFDSGIDNFDMFINEVDHEESYKDSWNEITSKYLNSISNKTRIEILRNL